jgi:hypothetical protein
MQVILNIKDWKIETNKKTGTSNITGEYEIISNGKSIASENFNTDYGGTKIPFSPSLIKEISLLDDKIKQEIKKLVS